MIQADRSSYEQTAEAYLGQPVTEAYLVVHGKFTRYTAGKYGEEEITGVYYNTAAVIDADGKYLGKYRKSHIPQVAPGFWEKYYFKPGNLGYPTFKTKYAQVGVYICYDRHFPEGARALGLNGAEIVFNPSATVAGLSEYLWKLEQPAHAAATRRIRGAAALGLARALLGRLVISHSVLVPRKGGLIRGGRKPVNPAPCR